MFGGDVKVSIHGNGECQLSRPGEWANTNNRPNAERHLHKWKATLPLGTAAAFVFEVRIPQSELKSVSVDEDLADIQWRNEAPKGYASAIQCFISPPASYSAVANAIPADSLLMVMPFAEGRWFVGRHAVMLLDQHELADVRMQSRKITEKNGYQITAEQRAAGLIIGEGSARGLIEYCLAGWPFFFPVQGTHTRPCDAKQLSIFVYSHELLDAVSVEKSGFKGMRLLIRDSLVTEELKEDFAISFGRSKMYSLRRLRHSSYPSHGDGLQDYLWPAVPEPGTWKEKQMTMSRRLRDSNSDPEEFAQAAATQVVFHEVAALLAASLHRARAARRPKLGVKWDAPNDFLEDGS
jgi:hypothetical protein